MSAIVTRVPAQMGQEVVHQDAGSNPGSGKCFYFSMTRFLHKKPIWSIETHNIEQVAKPLVRFKYEQIR